MDLQPYINKIGTVRRFGAPKISGRVYHEIPWQTFKSTYRKETWKTVQKIMENYTVKGKTGLDLGCSCGGVSFYLQLEGAKMTGIDYDEESLAMARYVNKEKGMGVCFWQADITPAVIEMIPHFDFGVFLATWHWIAKRHGKLSAHKILTLLSEKVDNLFFYSRKVDDNQKLIVDVTNYNFAIDLGIVEDGDRHNRRIFHCYK